MPDFNLNSAYSPTADQPQAIDVAGRGGGGRGEVHDPARRHRNRQDVHDGRHDREARPAGPGDRPQQDARRAALQRVPRVLPGGVGRVLRLLLRLLPARGVRAGAGPLHREGRDGQRRDRPASPRGDGQPVRPPRRDHRRLRLLHLRHRLAGAVPQADDPVQDRRVDRARDAVPAADRDAVPAQRHDPHPRQLPGDGGGARDLPRLRGVGLPDQPVRRRGRGDHPLRPADRRGARRGRPRLGLAGDPLRDRGGDDRAGGRGDPLRARGALQGVRGRGQGPRGAPAAPAHPVRPRDDEGARLLQRDRELLADPRQPGGRLRPAHADRLLPRATSSSSSTSRTRRCRRSAACTRAIARAS